MRKDAKVSWVTQNQVVATSCWFESGQGHQKFHLGTRERAASQIPQTIGQVAT